MATTLICSSTLISTRCDTLSSPPHRRWSSGKTHAKFPTSALSLAPPPAAAGGGYGKEKKAAAFRHYKRGELVVVRAGGPSTTTYLFAFFLPLSLIIVTVIASIRIADKLDEQYLEEFAMNKSIMEEREEENDDEEEAAAAGEQRATTAEEKIAPVEEAATPRARNRPKREV